LVAEAVGILAATSLTKLFPGIGSAINAAIATALTEALGWIVQTVLEARCRARIQGIPLPDIKVDFSNLHKTLKKIKNARKA
jgi:uncharacterized protein (DUF697 family)